MKKIIRLTESDLMNLVKRVISEQDEQNTHRYSQGVESPGIEQYLTNPVDKTISNGLSNQLRNDPYGKGKIVIIFNGVKFKEPGAFMNKILNDFNSDNCYEITNYEYNNRILLNTQIKITAKSGKCKKEEVPVKQNKKEEVPVKNKCKYKIKHPEGLLNRFYAGGDMKSKIERFQKRHCKGMPDGIWGCDTQTCYIDDVIKKYDAPADKIQELIRDAQ